MSARLPPTSARAPLRQRLRHVSLDDGELGLAGQSPDVGVVALAGGALAQAPHPLDDQLDEVVVDRLLDVDALNGGACLAAVEHGAPDRGVRRPLEIGVGEHDHRVLPPELQAVGDQPLGGALGNPSSRCGWSR